MHYFPTTTIHWLVAVSVLISVVASYSAFAFAERMATRRGAVWAFWLAGGALAMGFGIWSMHYLGMLSVHLPIDVAYHVPTVLLSLLLAVLASGVALYVVGRPSLDPVHGLCGSLLMGSGIGAMHYTGMHAMRCSAMHQYRPGLVVLSVVVSVVFSWMALWITFSMQSLSGSREWLRLAGAGLMGLGIAAMHYTAMAAVRFEDSPMQYSLKNTVHINTLGVAAVALTVIFVLFGALLTTFLDRSVYAKLRAMHEQLEEERDLFFAAAESSMDSLYLCSAFRDETGEIVDFLFTYLNSNVEKIVALPRSQMIGQKMCDLLPIVRKLGHFEMYRQVVITGQPAVCECSIDDKNVMSAWIRIQAVKARDGLAISVSDITARKRSEEQILYQAHHDPLTGLLNRSLLSDRIGQSLEMAKRQEAIAAVFMIDLDRFKQINDTYGHAAGDCVLVTVASRLKDIVRASDSVIRIGGDEFVVVAQLNEAQHAHSFAEKLLEALQLPIALGQQSITVTCSIGGALYPFAAAEIERLLNRADDALYVAKNAGRNQVHVITAEQAPNPGYSHTAAHGLTALRQEATLY